MLERTGAVEVRAVECGMADRGGSFYDKLADNYHLIFEDWDDWIRRQAEILGPILERECGADRLRLLDCACGIGTQAIGLPMRGHVVTGSDLSAAAVERARVEACKRGLQIDVLQADMRDLSEIQEGAFDAVLCVDNALAHLENNDELLQTAIAIRKRLRPDGIFVARTRDYDLRIQDKPRVQGPVYYSDEGRRRIVCLIWDWLDERRHALHLHITRELPDGWESQHYVLNHRAMLRSELAIALERAGFTGLRWIYPAASGFHQPILLARRTDRG